MTTSATRRILHITTDDLTDLKEKQFGNALSAYSYYKTPDISTNWGAKDIYGNVQYFAAWDKSVVFNKLYLGGDGGKYNPIIISRGAEVDEEYNGTTRGLNSINIGRSTGIGVGATSEGSINIGDYAGHSSVGSLAGGYGQVINIGFYTGYKSNGESNINIGAVTSYDMSGSYNNIFGVGAGAYTSGNSNSIIGQNAGCSLSGSNNIGIGKDSGFNLYGNDNVVLGEGAGVNTVGNYSILMGYSTGLAMQSNLGSIAIGRGAGNYSSGDYNTILGADSGIYGIGDNNLFIGKGIGYQSSGSDNVYIGKEGAYRLSGDGNIIIGRGGFTPLNSNYRNLNSSIILGSYAAETVADVGVDKAIVIGDHGCASATSIDNVLSIGVDALRGGGNCNNTISIGTSAGYASSGSNCIFIGNSIGVNNSENNKFAIGNMDNILLSGDFLTKEVVINHIKFPSTSAPIIVSGHSYIFASAEGINTELFVVDSNSNITKISPHNENGEWEYFCVNRKTGKSIRINMEKFIRKMEEITGETFIETV